MPTASVETAANPAKQYVPLHVHSDFSLLDGASQLPNLVERAAQLGVPAIALTDHGVLYGAIQLVRTCRQTDVKPIIGNEMYVVNEFPDPVDDTPDPQRFGARKRFHLIVLAKNTTGYRNLVKLTTMAHLTGRVGRGIFARPCVNKEQLYEHREGLIVSSACLGGEIAQAILNDDLDRAREVATWFRDSFGDDFYLEIQDHGSEEDKKVNPVMIQLSKELGIKAIATNDSHFTSCLDAEAHDALVCIQTGKVLTDENRLRYAGNEYFKSVEEMRNCFVDHLPIEVVDEALRNTLAVADKVDSYDLFGATRIPDFPVPKSFRGSHDKYLRHVSRVGLQERLKARVAAGLVDASAEDQYHERLELELDMICQMGFSSYFLVVWDYIRHARELNIPVGPGRGSAAGSLAAFALRITDVDPIPFNLLFERFLNPERKSMPDIDTDFSVGGREKIISYVTERYGSDRVAQIITFNRLTSKAVLKDVARVHSVPYAEADRLAKLIPVVRGKPATLSQLLSKETPSPDFKATIARKPEYKVWLDKAQRIEGSNKTYGIHAAGVVISATPLTDIVPLSKAKHGETITQYAMEDVESLGLLKMDFLGLKNLTVIETALEFINQGRRAIGIEGDIDFSVDALPLDDGNTYKLLSEGELDGIFQLDASGGMRNVVREMRPSSLEDISSILALYRPGPLDAGLIPKFIRRKHGLDPIEYDHPFLEPILKETYGIMVYQEQIMRIARDLAGYSLGQADILRRAMGKKKTKDMERERPRFVDGAVKRGVPQKTATDLFDMMIKFAEYCFNKSHSTAYAYLTYQTAYLKANYPVEYSAALLRSNMNSSDKLVRYLADANVLGVNVLPPCVNKSALGFTVDRSNKEEAAVLFGLEAVKTVGESVSKAILEEREAHGPFSSVVDLIERVDLRLLNRRALTALIRAGAFDGLHGNRKVLLETFEALLVVRRKLRDRRNRKEKKGMTEEEEQLLSEAERSSWEDAQIALARDSEEKPDFDLLERLAGEKASIGFYASGHPLYDLKDVGEALDCHAIHHIVGDGEREKNLSDEERVVSSTIADGTGVMLLSCVTDLKKVTTAKGKKMARWTIEDANSRVTGVVFPGAYDIIEQVREIETRQEHGDAKTDKDDIAEDDIEEPVHVVEEAARVVVWGRVDRESSGIAQVIVDDVQRVEDVKCVVATARFSKKRTRDIHLVVLLGVVKDALNVKLSDDDVKFYTDSNGVRRKQRHRKATRLSEKRRLPLILRCLDEHGNVASFNYAGNSYRLPLACEEILEDLGRQTNFKFEVMKVSDDILQSGSGRMRQCDAPMTTLRRSVDPKGERLAQTPDQLHEMRGKMERSVADLTSASKIVRLEDCKVTSFSRKDISPTASCAQPSNVIEVSEILEPEKSRSAQEADSKEEDSKKGVAEASRKEHATTTSSPQLHKVIEVNKNSQTERSKSAQEANSDDEDHGDEEEMKRLHGKSFSKSDLASYTANLNSLLAPKVVTTAVTLAEQANLSIANKDLDQRPDPCFRKLLETTAKFGLFSPHEAFTQYKAERSSTSMLEVQNEVLNDTEYTTLLSRDSVSETPAPERSSSSDTGVSERDFMSRLPLSEFDDPEMGGDAMMPQMEDVSMESPVGRIHTTALSGGTQRTESLSIPVSISQQIDTTAVQSDAPAVNLKDGITINFDSSGASGILDAICLIATEVASSYASRDCAIKAMTGLDIAKLIEEDAFLHVSGRVVFAKNHSLFVSVDVREKFPTGRRKRVRSFGPIVVVLYMGTEVLPVVTKTKKAMKSLDSARSILSDMAAYLSTSKSGSEMAGESRKTSSKRKASLKVVRSSVTELTVTRRCDAYPVASARLQDGGQLLLSMTRVAELCGGKITAPYGKPRVVSLVGFSCEDASVLKKEPASITIRAHVDNALFGVLAVQVEAIISRREGESLRCHAIFNVTCANAKDLKQMKVVMDDKPLFERMDMGKRIQTLALTIDESS